MITKEELERLYLVEHLTYAQIGTLHGVSKTAVLKWIRKYGIDTTDGESFTVKCHTCGTEKLIARSKFKNSNGRHYCNPGCFFNDKDRPIKFKPRGLSAARVLVTCGKCGKEFEKRQKVYALVKGKHYCGLQCYFADRYRSSRYGQKKAKSVMSEHLGRPLMFNEAVSFVDGDCENRNIENLVLLSKVSG